jgi:hypothetical protein
METLDLPTIGCYATNMYATVLRRERIHVSVELSVAYQRQMCLTWDCLTTTAFGQTRHNIYIMACWLNTGMMERRSFLRNYEKGFSPITVPFSDGCGSWYQTDIPVVTSPNWHFSRDVTALVSQSTAKILPILNIMLIITGVQDTVHRPEF